MLIYLVVLPYLHYRFKRYQHNNALLGSAEARFTATAGHFYAVYGILFGILLAIVLAFAAIGFLAGAGLFTSEKGAGVFGIGVLVLIIGSYVAYLLLFAAFVVLIQNRIWNHTTSRRGQLSQQRPRAADGAHLPGERHPARRHARVVHPIRRDSQS